ncbi:MAG: hypothetical protein ABEI32_10190 [Halothece sp.]
MIISNLDHVKVMSENEIVKGRNDIAFASPVINTQVGISVLGFGIAGDDIELDTDNFSDFNIN